MYETPKEAPSIYQDPTVASRLYEVPSPARDLRILPVRQFLTVIEGMVLLPASVYFLVTVTPDTITRALREGISYIPYNNGALDVFFGVLISILAMYILISGGLSLYRMIAQLKKPMAETHYRHFLRYNTFFLLTPLIFFLIVWWYVSVISWGWF